MLDVLDQGLFAQTLFGATIRQWLTLAVATIGISIILVLVRRVLAGRFVRLAKRTDNKIDDIIAKLLEDTRLYFIIALGLYLAVPFVDLPEVVAQNIGRLAFLVLLLQVVMWGNGLITLYIQDYKERKLDEDAAAVTTMQAVGFIGRLVLWSAVVLVALDNVGVDITALVAGLGVGGIAVALAVQNILGDLFASLSIVLDKPFVVGDFLIIGDFLGTVEHIGLKTTRLRSLSGEQIVFSNGDLLNSRIRNYKRMYERRVVFSIGVVYQTPYEQLEAIPGMLREAIEAQDTTRFDRAHFKGYGDFALTFEVVYYVLDPDYNLYMDIQQAINLLIYKRFEEENIEFAYPTRTLHVQPLRTEVVQADVHPGTSAKEPQ